jgi:hypothetical protein
VRRRGTVSRKPAKAQHRKPTRPKRSTAAMAAKQANWSLSELREQLKRQAHELEEAGDERAAFRRLSSHIALFSSHRRHTLSATPARDAPIHETIARGSGRGSVSEFRRLA